MNVQGIEGPLSDAVRQRAQCSVLCWLATADAQGQPNVSPKEVWAIVDARHVVVANIASPLSARNIAAGPLVCLSFVDVLVQKGYKLQGVACEVLPFDPNFEVWVAPLLDQVGTRFPIHSVLLIAVQSATPILAPSYRLYPEKTTEASQVGAAMRVYGLSHQRVNDASTSDRD